MTKDREEFIRKIHTDNRYHALELLDEIETLTKRLQEAREERNKCQKLYEEIAFPITPPATEIIKITHYSEPPWDRYDTLKLIAVILFPITLSIIAVGALLFVTWEILDLLF